MPRNPHDLRSFYILVDDADNILGHHEGRAGKINEKLIIGDYMTNNPAYTGELRVIELEVTDPVQTLDVADFSVTDSNAITDDDCRLLMQEVVGKMHGDRKLPYHMAREVQKESLKGNHKNITEKAKHIKLRYKRRFA